MELNIEEKKAQLEKEIQQLNVQLQQLNQAAQQTSVAILKKTGALDMLNELEKGQGDETSGKG